MMKQKIAKIFVTIIIVASLPWTALAQGVDPAFNPGKLIDDKVFSDTQTFGGAEGVQKFLEVKGSVLANTSPAFIAKLKEPGITMLKEALEDPRPNLGRLRTAAELIWDASKQSGLNPQVILVTLNKEQSLVTGQFNSDGDLQRALDHAMGFACPDSGGCDSLFPGFYYQLFGNLDADGNRYLGAAKSLMKSFATPGGRGPAINGQAARVGDVITLDNTMGGYEGILPQQAIQLVNSATAALYRYTPHVFNGNYNFWKFFTAWFRYPNGTLLSMASDVNTYIIQNGTKQLVPNFVAAARGLNLAGKITVSPNEFESYPTDKVFAPADNTIAKSGDGKTYVFLNGVKHLASVFVLTQRGLNPSAALDISSSDAALFDTGPVLPPKDGTIIRGKTDPAIYLVDGGQIKLFSAAIFKQRKITAKQITMVPDGEISTYTQNGFVPPLDGTLVKAPDNGTVYLIDTGVKKPLTAELFKNLGYSFKNVVTLAGEEVGSLALGPFASPKNKTFFAVDSKIGPLYEFKDGTKHLISAYVAKQRGITPDYVFSNSMAVTWYDGIPIPPRDGTVIMGDNKNDKTVYLVSGAQLRPLTYQAYKNRRIAAKKIIILPQAEVDSYAKGEILTK
ncbi:MAG: hypothetical protein M1383_05755 [Patescibacteria group bacterium]|nr:hypothetical protein [Patescibacteria group bacterium]